MDAELSKEARIERNRNAMKEFETCINACDLALARKLISEKAEFFTPVSPEPLRGAEGYLSVVRMMRASFPDASWRLDDMAVDEEKAAVRWTCSGTHSGATPFFGVPPSGRTFSACVMNFYYFDEDGKIRNDVAAEGLIAILQGIGALDRR